MTKRRFSPPFVRTPLFRALVLSTLVAAGTARAEPPPEGRGARRAPEGSAHPAARGSVRSAPAASGPPHERLERRIQELRQRLERTAADRERIETMTREVQESLRRMDMDADVLRQKLDALAAARPERQRVRRAALRAKWGKVLAHPTAREELTTHGRRMARLRRLQYLAATERQGQTRTKLLSRIDTLLSREQARHERAMKSLEENPGAERTSRGEPSSLPAPSPAPSGVNR